MSAPHTTILLVEDEPFLVQMYTTLFERKYHVVQALNKHRALEELQQRVPHLILLDLMIPIGPGEQLIEYDHPVGFDILEWVRHQPQLAQAAIIVLTNLESDHHRHLAQELGVDDYLVKANVSPDKLMERVDGILNSKERRAS